MRPTWDQTYLEVARVIAERSTCPRLHTACVIVNNNNVILTTGYNGSIRGQPHCDDVGCLMVDGHCARTVHAELNAILNAARIGATPLAGATAYVLHKPCSVCSKHMAQVGITHIRYLGNYDSHDSTDFLRSVGVSIQHVDI